MINMTYFYAGITIMLIIIVNDILKRKFKLNIGDKSLYEIIQDIKTEWGAVNIKYAIKKAIKELINEGFLKK